MPNNFARSTSKRGAKNRVIAEIEPVVVLREGWMIIRKGRSSGSQTSQSGWEMLAYWPVNQHHKFKKNVIKLKASSLSRTLCYEKRQDKREITTLETTSTLGSRGKKE